MTRNCRRLYHLLLTGLLVSACARAPEPLAVATALPTPRPLPAFVLAGADGRALTAAQLTGHPTLLFFGFASCPEICPTTLTTLASAVRQLADLPPARQPQVLFVSVDPGRDTPAALKDYARHFGPQVQAASGDKENLDRLTQAVGAHYAVPRDAVPAQNYAVEHSSQVYVIDANGRFMAVFSPPHAVGPIAADLRRLLDRGDRP